MTGLLLPTEMSLGMGSMLRPPDTEDKDLDTANDEGAKNCPIRPLSGLAKAEGLRPRSHSDAIATKENLSLLKDIKQK